MIKKKSGFTLIELIIVLTILAILALIAIPRYLLTRENANEGAVVANLRTIQAAAEVVAARDNIKIFEVDDSKIGEVIGMEFPVDFTNSPNGAVYGFVRNLSSETGLATLINKPDIYPADGVTKYSEISN